MATLRLLVAYDGTEFSGFQVQRDARTVQGVLEGALAEMTSEPVRVRAAGRTDAGVHALGQVASLRWSGPEPEAVLRATGGLLPADVGVLDAQWADDDFDARRSALGRSYAYLVWNHPVPHPLLRRWTLHLHDPVDPERLREALEVVRGTHDFSSFARVRPEQRPERTVRDVAVTADGPLLRIRITAESFLHQMVRSIVGSALQVGAGRRSLAWMREALLARDRAAAGPVASPAGLALEDVAYERAPWPRRPPVPWPWSQHVWTNPDVGCGPEDALGGMR